MRFNSRSSAVPRPMNPLMDDHHSFRDDNFSLCSRNRARSSEFFHRAGVTPSP